MRVLVICGGTSSEREVSLRSGKAVQEALQGGGHEVQMLDLTSDPTLRELSDAAAGCDVVFPILHGKGGEDGALQALLEELGVAFVGSGAQASRDCFDKLKTLQMLRDAGLPVPVTELVSFETLPGHPLTQRPFVLKPRDEGSSVDTYLIRNVTDFDPAEYRQAFARHGSLLIEELVEGIELTVPVLGDEALPVIEIIPPAGGEFDYENKYNGQSQELCPPVNITEQLQHQAQRLAEQVHAVMGCRHLSRTDMICQPDGGLKILEINTLPGMTATSLYPKAAQVAGSDMSQLVSRLVAMAQASAAAVR